jgi:hypothetical protein
MRRLFVAVMLSALLTAPALACGPIHKVTRAPHIPPLAAALDNLLPNAKLADAEMDNLKALRAEIAKLAADHKMEQARLVEAQAMKILGYTRMSLRCGSGTFMWRKFTPLKAVGSASVE